MSDTPGLVFLDDMDDRQKPPGFFRLYGKLLALFLLVLAGVLSFFLITQGALSYRVAGSEYERLKSTYMRFTDHSYDSDPVVGERTAEEVYPERPSGAVLEIDFAGLLQINPDTAGWLHVPALEISYPVVCAKDREYYTKHTFEGNRNVNGAVFAEPLNARDFTDRNTFLYGHNSADGSMFGRLHELAYADAGRDPFLYLYCENGEIRKYRLYSCYVTKEDSDTFRVIGEEDYDGYVRYTRQQALPGNETEFEGRGDLLTLSACYGTAGTDERLVVHGVRVP